MPKLLSFALAKMLKNILILLQASLEAGHTVGNHSFSHLNGWKTSTDIYLKDVEKCDAIVKSLLFRPPYGKLKPSQLRSLRKKYKIIMWSLMSGDFDSLLDKDKCLEVVLNNTKSGSIIVFHDSPKAEEKLLYVLPRLLECYSKQGYEFLSV